MADQDQDAQYWYNAKTGEVERGLVSPAPDRIGPFATPEEASRAYEILAERSRAWAEEEAREDDWDAGSGAP
ncbi:SPOR domain-containing protein [Microbacterium sp. Marseille-Q6965]|uniref:SPOR domain-containing protein n=1 Tax=Microbacterium sp. Marseille-Q6965 TaxID=2965072 RepID=UPI0021B78929|nr:SPOR domain-containing protein [Microbacterium sp. Marseille-Q6965]